ncbi:MAG TPA: FAD binding domain-containing protein [Trebonia sp.]
MKAPPFAYRSASSVRQAVDVLALAGADAAVLAGGQSLLIDLHYRRIRPLLVLDINPVRELEGVRVDTEANGGMARIGALVRHRELESLPLGDPLDRMLSLIAGYVAHPPVRTRGTFAGSVAWAHPAAEWCALTAGLAGAVETSGAAGQRRVPAAEWFAGRHRTARRPDELVTAVWLPLLGAGTGVGFAEHRRTHASFAMAASCAAVRLTTGRVTWARIGMANAADVPVRAVAAERLLVGNSVSRALLTDAAEQAAAAADPVPEPYCSPEYRRQALRVLVRRSLAAAVADAVAS